MHLHLKLGWAVGIALTGLALWRWVGGVPNVSYLVAGWLVATLVLMQAWLGGELVYAHGAGVAVAEQGTQPADQAQQPSLRLYQVLTGRSPKSHGHDHGDGGESGHH